MSARPARGLLARLGAAAGVVLVAGGALAATAAPAGAPLDAQGYRLAAPPYGLSTGEISRRVGIRDGSNLGKLFRKFEGMSPQDYRRRFGRKGPE